MLMKPRKRPVHDRHGYVLNRHGYVHGYAMLRNEVK